MQKNKLELTICEYQEADKKELIKLIQLSIPTYFEKSEEKDFANYLENYKEDYFVIKDKVTNQIIGCGGINYFFDAPIPLARISWDMVHPDFQGKGVGKKLLLHRINYIQSKEIRLIIVRTSQLAYKFYQKVGFEIEKTEKDFWAKGFDLYQMKMNL